MLVSKNINVNNFDKNDIVNINDHEFFIKIPGPTFDIHDTFNLSFQPRLSDFNNLDIKEKYSVIVFPIIPQYFHNFFEMFSKVIKLKNSGEFFKVVLVFDENYYGLNQIEGNKKTNGIFNFLIRELNHPGPNSSHLKDFFDYVNVEFVCLTVEELKDFKPSHCYLFFDDGDYYEQDPFIILNQKKYSLANFLKVPNLHISLNDIDNLRYVLPTSFVSKQNKIFISRKKTRDRKYQYENELEDLMVSIGYKNVYLEDLSMMAQIRILQTSSHIVCAYGSALVNCCLLNNQNNVLAINYTPGYSVGLYDEFFKKYKIPYTEININNDFDPTNFLRNKILEWENKISNSLNKNSPSK